MCIQIFELDYTFHSKCNLILLPPASPKEGNSYQCYSCLYLLKHETVLQVYDILQRYKTKIMMCSGI